MRDPYAIVGAAVRQASQRARDAHVKNRKPGKPGNLSECDYATLLAVIAYTAGWSRMRDTVSAGYLAKAIGFHPQSVRRSLGRLDALQIIYWIPKRGTGARSIVGLHIPESEHLDAHIQESLSERLDALSKLAPGAHSELVPGRSLTEESEKKTEQQPELSRAERHKAAREGLATIHAALGMVPRIEGMP